MTIKFFSSKESEETCIMYSKIDNIEVMMGSKTDKIIEEIFHSFLRFFTKIPKIFRRINERK